MVLNPNVQHKAQDEIARVCDPNQLPSLDDVDSLPYVTAVVLEVLRWSASVPLGALSTVSP
jgi:cytochrome P450